MKQVLCSVALLVVFAVLEAWAPSPALAGDLDTWVPTADEVRQVATQRTTYPSQRRRTWAFDVAVPLWIPGVSGTFGQGGVSVDTDGGIGDVAGDLFDVQTDLDFAFVGAFRASRGPWSLAVEGFGVRLGNNIDFTLTDGTLVDTTIGAVIASARVGRRVWTKPMRILSTRSCFTVDAYAGVRWYYASLEVTLPVGPGIDTSSHWIDPIVGLDTELSLGRHLALHLRGDVGGFGVGSDLAFWVVAGLEYRLSRVFSLGAGWAVMDADYTSGVGDREFRWNLTLSGPQLIAAFRF